MSEAPDSPGFVLLSGPSGAGKTTLARKLLAVADGPCIHIEADLAFPRITNVTTREAIVVFHSAAKTWCDAGLTVLMDGSLPYDDIELRARCLQALSPYPVKLLGVTADPATLENRARERGHADLNFGVSQRESINEGLDLVTTVNSTLGLDHCDLVELARTVGLLANT